MEHHTHLVTGMPQGAALGAHRAEEKRELEAATAARRKAAHSVRLDTPRRVVPAAQQCKATAAVVTQEEARAAALVAEAKAAMQAMASLERVAMPGAEVRAEMRVLVVRVAMPVMQGQAAMPVMQGQAAMQATVVRVAVLARAAAARGMAAVRATAAQPARGCARLRSRCPQLLAAASWAQPRSNTSRM